MSCTCETYGHCHVCRSTEGRTEPRGEFAYQSCAWCGHTFVRENMFTIGYYHDHDMVCGSDCPERPPRENAGRKRTDDVINNYRVQYSVEVEATNIEHAKNIVRITMRKVPRLKFERIVMTQRKNYKDK